MSTLLDICSELNYRLTTIGNFWNDLVSDLRVAQDLIDNQLKNTLSLKLAVLKSRLISECQSLYEKKNDSGCVYLMLNDKDGFVPHWIADEQDINTTKSWLKIHGTMIMPPQQAVKMIDQAQNMLANNEYQAVINFLHKFGQSTNK